MKEHSSLNSRMRWIILGILSTVLANADFVLVSIMMADGALPAKYIYTLSWLFGPLVIVAALGIYEFLVTPAELVRLKLARLFMVIAGVCITITVTVRGAMLYGYSALRPDATDQVGFNSWSFGQNALMLTQRGLELAWGIFIYLAMFLFATVLLSRGVVAKVLGVCGIVISLVGIATDIYVWPADAETKDLVNFGPMAGLWFVGLALMMAFQLKRIGRDT